MWNVESLPPQLPLPAASQAAAAAAALVKVFLGDSWMSPALFPPSLTTAPSIFSPGHRATSVDAMATSLPCIRGWDQLSLTD